MRGRIYQHLGGPGPRKQHTSFALSDPLVIPLHQPHRAEGGQPKSSALKYASHRCQSGANSSPHS
eukprot:10084965-Prorocentrum_lima.AAC.1